MLERTLQTTLLSPDSLVCNGIFAVHIAVFWPRGLKILLDIWPKTNLNIICNELTPLGLAMFASGGICQGNLIQVCENCPCAESIEILLDSRCHVTESINKLRSLIPTRVHISYRALFTF